MAEGSVLVGKELPEQPKDRGDGLPEKAQPATPAEVSSTANDNIRDIIKRTGYSLTVTVRQRKYGGPPPNWDGPDPGSNCKIFCSGIPRDIFEDILIPLFEDCGKIWELTLMMNPKTGTNRGYAFVTFTRREAAVDAMRQLDNHEIKPGMHLKIEIEKLRLFVGNIPMSKSKEMIFAEFDQITSGLEEVIVYNTPDMNRRNRGYCFLDYRTHAAASLAKKRLCKGAFKVWGRDIVVDWADPLQESDEQTMAKVKVLYVRNLSHEVTEDKLKEQFGQYGEVERVKKIKDFAFVHFENRDNALEAMEKVTGIELDSPFLQISLAIPPEEKKKREKTLRERNRRLLQERPNISFSHPIHQRGGYQLPLRPTMVAPNENYNYRNYPVFQGCCNHFPEQSSHYQYPAPQTAGGSRGGFRGHLRDPPKRTQTTQTEDENFLDTEEVRDSYVGAQFAKPQQNLTESINLYEYPSKDHGGYKATHYTDFSLFDKNKFTSKSIATATQTVGDQVRASEGGTQLAKSLQNLAISTDSLEYRDENFLDAEEVRASVGGAHFVKPLQKTKSINLHEYPPSQHHDEYKATYCKDFTLFYEEKFTSKSIAIATQTAGEQVRASEGGTQLAKSLQNLAISTDSLEYRDEYNDNALYQENFSLFYEQKYTFKYSLSAEEGVPENAGGLRHYINEDSDSKESAIAKAVIEQIEN